MAPWKAKAHSLIASAATAAYNKANRLPDGRLRKRHVPYSLPQMAHDLVQCLRTDDELTAKALFNLHAFSSEALND